MALSVIEPHVRGGEAAIEKRKRRRARRNLLDFARYVMPNYETPPHIELIAEKLEAVERGEIKRLMIFMPPQRGKSTAVTQIFPCWMLGRDPEASIAVASYVKELALYQSRRARDIFVSDKNRIIFPQVHHRPEKAGQMPIPVERQAAHEWGTTSGGSYYAVGVGGPLTGKPITKLGIIDDPIKDMEQAESETIREKVWEWYQSVFLGRVHESASIILVMTRWHTDDLAGRLLEQQDSGGESWDILSLPALHENGESLWPSRWPKEYVEGTKRSVSERVWAAQYMQQPYVSGGNRFKVDGIQIHDGIEDFPDVQYVRFWDLAFTTKQRGKNDPDYTVGSHLGVVRADEVQGGVVNHIWIKDIRRGQWDTPPRDRVIMGSADKDGPAVEILCESVGGQKGAVDALAAALKGKRICRGITVSQDKVTRAAPMEAPFEAGNVHLLKADWNDAFLREFREFPAGKHDDIVDACSGAYNELNTEMSVGCFDARGFGR